MKLTDKNIWKYEGLILLWCIITMLLHPLSFMEITWLIEGAVIPTYLCSYLLGSVILQRQFLVEISFTYIFLHKYFVHMVNANRSL